MGGKESGHAEGKGGDLPAGVQQRLSWHPPAVRAVDSLLAGMAGRVAPLLHRAAQLTAWHGRFTRRVRPGWTPLFLEFVPGEGGVAETVASARTVPRRESDLSGDPSPPTRHPAVSSPRATPHRPGTGSTLSRPAVGLAILRVMSGTPDRGNFQEASDARPFGCLFPQAYPAPLFPGEVRSAVQPPVVRGPGGGDSLPFPGGNESFATLRIGPSTSPFPRREVRGGFPLRQSAEPAPLGQSPPKGRAEAPGDIASLGAPAVLRSPHETSERSPAQQAAAIQGSPSREPRGAIEKFLEQYVIPAPLPGLELRLVSPKEEPPHGLLGTIEEREERGNTSPPASGPTPSPSPAPLDINAVADKVYQTLMRRQQIERERKGLY